MDWEGVYEVSDHGRVRSIDRKIDLVYKGTPVKRWVPGQMLSLKPGKNGYVRVNLRHGGRVEAANVHVLVARAFHGEPEEGQEVRHYPDPDPTNNRASNLRWGTRLENIYDSVEHRTHSNSRKTECPSGHKYTPDNTIVSRRGNGRKFRMCRTCVSERVRQED